MTATNFYSDNTLEIKKKLTAYGLYWEAHKYIGVSAKSYDDFIKIEDIAYWLGFDLAAFKLAATPQFTKPKPPLTIKYKVLNAPTTPASETLFKERLLDPS